MQREIPTIRVMMQPDVTKPEREVWEGAGAVVIVVSEAGMAMRSRLAVPSDVAERMCVGIVVNLMRGLPAEMEAVLELYRVGGREALEAVYRATSVVTPGSTGTQRVEYSPGDQPPPAWFTGAQDAPMPSPQSSSQQAEGEAHG